MAFYQLPSDEYYVNRFLAGCTIDGLARELHLSVRAAKKKGKADESMTLKECRGIIEKAIYQFYMDRRPNHELDKC